MSKVVLAYCDDVTDMLQYCCLSTLDVLAGYRKQMLEAPHVFS